mgnify:CR=1 FL=1
MVLELDGEVITRAEPVLGYMHRGAEKLAEFRDARQTLVLMNRHDWLSAFNNELGFVMAVERIELTTAMWCLAREKATFRRRSPPSDPSWPARSPRPRRSASHWPAVASPA